MATISELQSLIYYQDRARERADAKERQAFKDNWQMFTTVASQRLNTSKELVDLSQGETDLGALKELKERIEENRTGVDFIDDMIEVRADEVELRSETVEAENDINEQINTLNNSMGDGITVGAKNTLDSLRKQYRNIVGQQTNEAKQLMKNRLDNAQDHLTLQLWKKEFDTDPKKEGYQFPKHMSKMDQSYFTETVLPGVRVAEGSRDYTSAIKGLQEAFPGMRREETAYVAAGVRRDKQVSDDAAKEAAKKQNQLRSLKFNEVGTLLTAANQSFASLKLDNKDLPTQNAFSESLPLLSEFTSSMTGENLQSLDVRGAIRAIDKVIIINSMNDKNNLKGMLPNYGLDMDPLTITNQVDKLIAENETKNAKGEKRYMARYGDAGIADRGMFELIEARKKLIEIANTPGMLIEEADTGANNEPKTYNFENVK